VSRDHRHEQLALANLLADGSVPRISAAQLALVEPDLNVRCPKRFTDPTGRLGIL
jgi:hypothetical protein